MYMKIFSAIGVKIRELLALDYRSLALLRIGVGTTILFDLIQRGTDLVAHYTDSGVLPRSELIRLWDMSSLISLHMASGQVWFQLALFIVAGIFAIFLITGYRTTLSAIISFFLLISLQSRNPMVLQGGDVVLRAVLFFMLFLPLGKRWSLDRLFNRIPAPLTKKTSGILTLGYITQICLLYILTGVLKSGAPWHADGSAVYYALQIDQLVTPIGVFLRNIPILLTPLTHLVWYFETFGTLLFFIPWKNWIWRTIGIFGFIALQIGFNLSFRLGLFGTIGITTLLGLLPSEFWDILITPILNRFRSRAKSGLTIVYDFDCTFCYKMSFLLKRILLLNDTTIVIASEKNAVAHEIMERENSWVIIDEYGNTHTRWDGFITVFTYSPYGKYVAPLLAVKPVSYFGEKLYKLVAQKRKLVCEPEPIAQKNEFLDVTKTIVVSFFVVYVVLWNIETLNDKIIIPKTLRTIGYNLHIDQKFNMFAPMPLLEDGWYVMPGKLRNGKEIDVFSGATTVSYEKPAWVAYTYKNQRWQKYLMNLWSSSLSDFRLGYGKYLCRVWNGSHPYNEHLMSFDIIFMLETTPPEGQQIPKATPTTIWHHDCF